MKGGGRQGKGRGRGRGIHRGSHRGHQWNGGFRGHRGGARGDRSSGPSRSQNRRFPQVVGPRLEEADVGITEFIGEHDGFLAVIKHRFSDFHVNEIDSDGYVVKLTSLDVPPEESSCVPVERHELIPEEIWEKLSSMVKKTDSPLDAKESKMCDSSLLSVNSPNKSIPESDKKLIRSIASESNSPSSSTVPGETQSRIIAIENTSPSVSSEKSDLSCEIKPSCDKEERKSKEAVQFIELDVTSLDKQSRRAIHTCVKGAFKELNSNTTEKDGKKYVVFSLGKGGKRDNRGKWPTARAGEYLHFVVHKRNMDTTETVNIISQRLWMKANNITFAGTKDRRGITSQRMAVRRGEPSRFYQISRQMPCVFLGNYCFKDKPLRLGDLKGNQFRIALRNVQGSDKQINDGLDSLKNNGFINYYGLQRFGTNKAVPTHCVGKALLLGDWQKAIDLILEPREGFQTEAALKEWKSSRDAKAALKKLEAQTNGLEEQLLNGLASYGPKDFVNALNMLPLNSRLMYLHAYQSLIWNKAVSKRIEEFGLKPIEGDLVLVKSEKETESLDQSGSADDPVLLDTEEVAFEENSRRQEVRFITEEDLDNFTMADIVLPLPGYNVVFPNNSIGIFMKDLLKEDGLTPESLQQQVRQYSVKGTYRHIVARADKLTWKIVNYNESEADLIPSDFDEMMKGKKIADDKDGKYKALVVCMCLEPSTYATMAIREITKSDTSATTQASISAAATAKEMENASLKNGENREKEVAAQLPDDGNENESESAEVSQASSENTKRTTTDNGSSEELMLVSSDTTEDVSPSLQSLERAVGDTMEVSCVGVSRVKRKADEESNNTIAEKKIKET